MSPTANDQRVDRLGLVTVFALAGCCLVPMLAILGMTSLLGVSLGWSAALMIGVVAALLCVALAAAHHRGSHLGRSSHDA